MSFNESLGHRLKEVRQKSGLSQAGMGKLINVSFQQIQKYESGANAISLERLDKLAKELGVSLMYFIEDASSKSEVAPFSQSQIQIFKEIKPLPEPKQDAVLEFIKLLKKL